MAIIYEEGQRVRHGQYGLGTILASDEDRTAIDFAEHGTKKFVTSLVVLELTGERVVKSAKKPARRTAKAKK